MNLKGVFWLVFGVGFGASLYFVIPLLVSMLPRKVEKVLFSGFSVVSPGEICKKESAPLHKLVQRLFPVYANDKEFDVEVAAVHRKEVNAFAFLDDRIFVMDGLLQEAESPEELAGVLAHEMEHVKRRHASLRMAQSLVTRLLLPKSIFGLDPQFGVTLMSLAYDRSQEEEADEGGLERLREAKISNAGFAKFFERLGKKMEMPAILSTHPSYDSRQKRAESIPPYPTLEILSADEWKNLKQICH